MSNMLYNNGYEPLTITIAIVINAYLGLILYLCINPHNISMN